MADGSVRVAPDSTGKIIDTTELTRTSDSAVVERQRVHLAGTASAAIVEPINTTPAGTEYAIPTRPVALPALAAGTNAIGTVAAPAITKGTQGTTGFMVQDLKDSGRVPVVISASGVVSVTAVGLITFNMYRGGAVTSVSNYTVPANKTFRMQAVQFGVRFTTMSTTVTFGNTTFAIRYSPSGSGAVVVTSPILIQDSKAAASNVPTPNSDLSIPDGLELPAGHTLGVTHLASAATLSEDILIVGYEF